MAKPNKFYENCPPWLQNCMVSAYGVKRHWQRHGGEFRKWVRKLTESQWYSAQQFVDYQQQRLMDIVSFSRKHVPYFRDSFSSLPKDLTGLSIKDLPLMDKDTIRTNPDACRANCWNKKQLLEYHTSGSTGTPLTVYFTVEDLREHMAFLERQRLWAGVREGQRCATLTGNLVVGRERVKPPFWRYNLFGNQLLISSYHITPENLPSYVQKLEQFKPIIIEGYPSSIYVVAQWLLENPPAKVIRPKAVLTTAETLHDYQRETIERAFGTRVYNYYGSSEGAPLITECEHGRLHTNPECGIFEILAPDGSSTSSGQLGELVVTTFGTHSMPLIRYRIRDAVIAEDSSLVCPCNRQMPIIKEIVGRLDDLLFTREKGWVGRLSQTIKVFPGSVKESQIIQETIDRIVVKLVPDPKSFDKSQLKPFIADLKQRLGNVDITIHYVDKISKGAMNKFKFVICNLSDEEKQQYGLKH